MTSCVLSSINCSDRDPVTSPQVPTRQAMIPESEEVHNFNIGRATPLSPDDARDYLLCYATSQSCYGKSAARQMVISNIISSHGLHYTLETFSETRQIDWTKEAFTGGQIDDSTKGTPPSVWNVEVTSNQDFVDQVKEVKIPHTETLKTCNKCQALGVIKCDKCEGLGTKRCETCFGNGVTYTKKGRTKMCKTCGGPGRLKCTDCNNSGHVKCPDCLGYKRLKWFALLTVKFVNHVEDDVVQHQTGLVRELFREASGDRVFQYVGKRVAPLSTPDDQVLNACSKKLVEKHKEDTKPNERVLKQRHTLRAVPVSEVHWTWKDKAGSYWVYGFDRRVHCPRYPQSSCYGCAVL
ncbi:protein SSUH2 homolog isoform X2 [Ptychodera flava]|uniref:protein SSUH2 homolog isoform X2 n=1 Tax=Ptychodera flava TaxID=63121 RepID=UPI00396A0641